MKIRIHMIVLLFGLIAYQLPAQVQFLLEQGGFYTPPSSACISSDQRQFIQKQLKLNIENLTERGLIQVQNNRDVILLEWPLKANDDYSHYDYHGVSNFVDHDVEFPENIIDYNCGERSYDTEDGYNHSGTDFFLWPFAWNLMDANQIRVVAAAPGVIIGKMDGEPDRNCDLQTEAIWNAVFIQHNDGSQTWYGHLKKHSLTNKSIGDRVEAGDFLGFVGSSGISSGPHLHFEVYDAAGNVVDPFAGECSENYTSWWLEQRSYYDSGLNRIETHSAAPILSECPEPDVIYTKNEFNAGDTVFFSVYLRDQLSNQLLDHQVYQPDGSSLFSWASASNAAHYPASYWYFPIVLPTDAEIGEWTYEVEYVDQTYSHTFRVNKAVPIREVSIGFSEHGISPNPVGQDFSAWIDIFISGTFEFEIRDVMGRLMQKRVILLLEGQHELDFVVDDLPSGLYLLAVSDEKNAVAVQKFLKE